MTKKNNCKNYRQKYKLILYLIVHKLLNIKGNAVSLLFVQAQLCFTLDGGVPVILHRVVCSAK